MSLNATPVGSDTLELYPVDISGEQGTGLVFSFQYQPQGSGDEPPEPEDSLLVYFKNDNNDWIKIFSVGGDSLQPFAKQDYELDSLSNSANNLFTNHFQIRIISLGNAHPFFARDDWFVDNVYFGTPAAMISSDKNFIEFDTTGTGYQDTVILEIQNIGVLDYNVLDVLGSGGVFSADTTHFTVPAGNHYPLPVIFNPAQTGMYQGIFNIVHDIPNADTLTITLYGVSSNISGIEETTSIPKEFRISQNYPNPFNPTTKIYYELPVSSEVHLEIYDILGKKVRTLLNNKIKAGYHEVSWDGDNDFNSKVSSGIYIYKFSARNNQKEFSAIKKMIFIK